MKRAASPRTVRDLQIGLLKALGLIALKQRARRPGTVLGEIALTNQLRRLFGSVPAAVIAELTSAGRLPADPTARAQLVAAITQIESQFQAVVADGAVDAAHQGSRDARRQLAGLGMTVSGNRAPQRVIDAARAHAFTASAGTMERLTGDVQGVIVNAIEDGLSIPNTVTQLRTVFDNFTNYGLIRIARTEIHSAQESAAHETMRAHGILYERWVATLDERVRDSHYELHNEIVGIDDLFSNGLLYPGDMDGPLEEFILCRCRAVPFIPPAGAAPVGDGPWRADDFGAGAAPAAHATPPRPRPPAAPAPDPDGARET